MSPETVGRYRVIRELGRGAMGVVYEASDPNLGRTVALKTIHANAIGTNPQEAAQRFKNEARAAGSLSHPNIVTVFDAGEQDGLLYIAMELLAGETLEAHLAKQRTVPFERAIDVTRQICAALDYANAKGIVHRDIKPANIILLPSGTVKITDFGLARTAEAITMTGQVMGTPHYMSPEQVRGRPVDGRSDLFSVGVMLYEMVTGERPFEGHSITTIMYKIVHESPTSPRALDSSIPPGLSAVIEQSMAKSPEERFQTGAALASALDNYKKFEPASASTTATVNAPTAPVRVPSEPTAPAPSEQPPATKSRSIRKLPIVAICIVIATFVWLLASQRNKGTDQANHVQQVQAPPPPTTPNTAPSPENSAQAEHATSAHPAEVIEKQPSTPGVGTATMAVNSNPPTATIFLDNKSTGLHTPAQLQLPRGEHTVSVRMAGFQPSSAKFRVKGGEDLEFSPQLTVELPSVPGVSIPAVKIPDMDMQKLEQLRQNKMRSTEFWQQWAKAAELSAERGGSAQNLSLLVNTKPAGAHIWVDGNDTGKTSPAIIPEKPGTYHVRVQLDGYQPVERDVKVKPGHPGMVNIPLKPASTNHNQ
ncbi:MAG: serine/threonine-protein kinase [Terriglobales bacterium]